MKRCVPVLYQWTLLLWMPRCFLQPTRDLLVWEFQPVTLQWETRQFNHQMEQHNKRFCQTTLWRVLGKGEILTMSLALGWRENNSISIVLKPAVHIYSLLSCFFPQFIHVGIALLNQDYFHSPCRKTSRETVIWIKFLWKERKSQKEEEEKQ